MAGDEVQFLKAGIMEVPDEIILNKCDAAEAARKSHLALLSSLRLARPFDADRIPVHQASARTGFGLERLAERFAADLVTYRKPDLRSKEAHYFEEWIRDEWGRVGLRFLEEHAPDIGGYLVHMGGYDAAQRAFGAALRRAISTE
jgi:LAO/AO transport system kinase